VAGTRSLNFKKKFFEKIVGKPILLHIVLFSNFSTICRDSSLF
jgi:hypothetical protein